MECSLMELELNKLHLRLVPSILFPFPQQFMKASGLESSVHWSSKLFSTSPLPCRRPSKPNAGSGPKKGERRESYFLRNYILSLGFLLVYLHSQMGMTCINCS